MSSSATPQSVPAGARLRRLLAHLELDPNNLTLLLDATREAAGAGLWGIALHLVETGLARHPDQQIALTVLRARCFQHTGRSAQAIDDCKRCLARAPDHAEAAGCLALLLYDQQRSSEAGPYIDTALAIDPTQLEALLAKASRQLDTRDVEGARQSLNTLVQAHPTCGRAWFGLALLDLGQMQLEAAKCATELAAQYMQEHIGTWHILGWIQILRGDIAAAATAFERALTLNRNFGETHGGLAVIAALQGHEAEARASVRRALRLDPQGMAAQCAQYLLLHRQGQQSGAQALMDAFLARPLPGDESGRTFRDVVATNMRRLHS
ncbi:MAG TPA: tetratricopeptide repeat protein [Steroidobacteraceae bacterium]